MTEENKHLWTEGSGFLGESGCRLSREDMPKECREYTCKNEMWYTIYLHYTPLWWNGERWEPLQAIEGWFTGPMAHMDQLLEVIDKNTRTHNEYTRHKYFNGQEAPKEDIGSEVRAETIGYRHAEKDDA